MASQVISFRFTEQEIELLRQQSLTPDESTNAIAQRLLREIIGVSMILSTDVDSFSERVQAVVVARIENTIYDFVDSRIQMRIQQELAPLLGELSV